jgi:hypothetical protein
VALSPGHTERPSGSRDRSRLGFVLLRKEGRAMDARVDEKFAWLVGLVLLLLIDFVAAATASMFLNRF